MVETITTETWIGMGVAIVAFWGVAGWALVRTLRDEERKVELVERQNRLESHSPEALADLRRWIESNPDDPAVDDARRRYNQTVEVLESGDEPFYDWSDEEIESLERL